MLHIFANVLRTFGERLRNAIVTNCTVVKEERGKEEIKTNVRNGTGKASHTDYANYAETQI